MAAFLTNDYLYLIMKIVDKMNRLKILYFKATDTHQNLSLTTVLIVFFIIMHIIIERWDEFFSPISSLFIKYS